MEFEKEDMDNKYTQELHDYRHRELKTIVEFIGSLLQSKATSEYTRGALDLFSKLILIPLDMAGTPEERVLINNIISKEFEEVKIDLVRKLTFRDD